MNFPGPDERFGDSVSGRSGLLPGVERDDLGCERRERAPLNETAGPDHPEEHPGDETLARNSQREGFHFQQHAGEENIPTN